VFDRVSSQKKPVKILRPNCPLRDFHKIKVTKMMRIAMILKLRLQI